MGNLLDKAKKIRSSKLNTTITYSDEELELFTAYLRGEVQLHQVAKILKIKHNARIYNFTVQAVRAGFRDGRLKNLS